jgi:integrase
MSRDEYDAVSETNRNIIHKFVTSMQHSRKITSERTIINNAMIIKFMLQNIKTDLDKLTIDDIDDIQADIANWTRKDGKSAAEASKKVYSVGVKKFLNWYAKRYEKPEYKNFAELIEIGGDAKKVLSGDLLTTAEIDRMIAVANKIRDKAIIAVLVESGCRAGELILCRVRDVVFTANGYRLTFPKGKTGARSAFGFRGALY